MEATTIASKVSRNFESYAEATAFQDGINVALGLFPPTDNQKITLGHIFPLTPIGYTTTIISEKDFEES